MLTMSSAFEFRRSQKKLFTIQNIIQSTLKVLNNIKKMAFTTLL